MLLSYAPLQVKLAKLEEELAAANAKAIAAAVAASFTPEQQADAAVRTTALDLQQQLLTRASENARLSVAVAEMVVSQHIVMESLSGAIAAAGNVHRNSIPIAELQPLVRVLEGGLGIDLRGAGMVGARSIQSQRVALLDSELSAIQQEVERAEDLVAALTADGEASSERVVLLTRQLLRCQEEVGILQEQLLQKQEVLLAAALKADPAKGVAAGWSQRAAVLALGSENVALKQEGARKAAAMRRMAARVQELQAAVLQQQGAAQMEARNAAMMQVGGQGPGGRKHVANTCLGDANTTSSLDIQRSTHLFS